MATVTVPLTRGKFALIDAEDADTVLAHKWHSEPGRRGTWYAATQIAGRYVSLHRLILGEPKGLQVDHRSRDGLDCRRANLRICTARQNQHNAVVSARNISGFKGVSFHKLRNKWQAKIRHNGCQCHLGYFSSPVDAALAYDEAARGSFKDFARLNFPGNGEQSARDA